MISGYRPNGDAIVWKYDTVTSDAGGGAVAAEPLEVPDLWLRIEDDNIDITFSCSTDGINWFELFSEGRTVWPTTAFDEVGFSATSRKS